jgi:hypothetical protein
MRLEDHNVHQTHHCHMNGILREDSPAFIHDFHLSGLQTFPERVELKAVLPDEVRDLAGYLGTKEGLGRLSEIIGQTIENFELEVRVSGRRIDALITCAPTKQGCKQNYGLEFQLGNADQNHLGKFCTMMSCATHMAGGIWLAAGFSAAMISDVAQAQLNLDKPLYLVELSAAQGATGFCIHWRNIGVVRAPSVSDQIAEDLAIMPKGKIATRPTNRKKPRGQSQVISDAKNARFKLWWPLVIKELSSFGFKVHETGSGSGHQVIDKAACGISLGTHGAKLHVLLRKDREAIGLRLDFTADVRKRLLPHFEDMAQSMGLTIGKTSPRGGNVQPTLLVADIPAPSDATVNIINVAVRKVASFAQAMKIEVEKQLTVSAG